MLSYHIPVMLQQSVGGLNLSPSAFVADVTFGGGGHSKYILEKIQSGRLFAFDQDIDTVANLPENKNFTFIRHNFRYIRNFLHYYGVSSLDAILADLGVSSHDFDSADRGFSHRFDGDLDMRMNVQSEKKASLVVNSYAEEELVAMFRNYGEIFNAPKLATEICRKREIKSIKTTGELKEIALGCCPRGIENKYLSQVFQALRIEVNEEMEALKEFLSSALELLKPGGRLVILTYHSLEDRICKNFMKTGNFEGQVNKDFYGNLITPFKMITRKAITPDENELRENPRSRSAKLRIAEKI